MVRALLQDIWLIEKLGTLRPSGHPERRMHAKGSGAYGTFTTTHDITRYTKAATFSRIGKHTPMFARFSTVRGSGAADAERDIRGTAPSFTPRTEIGTSLETILRSFSSAILYGSLTSTTLSSATRAPACGAPKMTAFELWSLLSGSTPPSAHIVMSERGIPKSFRHMHLFGSHFSL